MDFGRLSILGVGLLGGSIGLAARSAANACKVIGYGHRLSTLDRAMSLGAVTEAYDSLEPAVRGSDLILLCTPVGLFRPLLEQLAPLLQPGVIVTDVGSTKRSFVSAAEAILPAGVHVVGSHPMAGSEKRGVDHADPAILRDALCVVTPTDRTDKTALTRVEAFWRELGMRTVRMTPAEHDRRIGFVSHLPHAVASALISLQDSKALNVAGKGFADATRIAAGDAGLWRDIFLDNADNLRDGFRRVRAEIDRLESLLDPEKSLELEAWLAQAAARRNALNLAKRE